MSIGNNSNKRDEDIDKDLDKMLNMATIKTLSSKTPIQQIKNNILLNMVFGIIICLGYVWLIYYFPIWPVQLALGITLIFSLWAIYTAYVEYKKLSPYVSALNPLIEELKSHKESINEWMKIQTRVALFIYPISAAGGFMLGGVLGSGKDVEILMSKPLMWVILFGVLLILVPLCHFGAKWMAQQAFGKHLSAIQQNIDDLESEK